jgi:hypothetical protein
VRVEVEVEGVELENNSGREIPGITVTCTKCGHTVEVFGQSEASIKRGCVMLKEMCDERNFYVAIDYE